MGKVYNINQMYISIGLLSFPLHYAKVLLAFSMLVVLVAEPVYTSLVNSGKSTLICPTSITAPVEEMIVYYFIIMDNMEH